jgi:hypothetical protein
VKYKEEIKKKNKKQEKVKKKSYLAGPIGAKFASRRHGYTSGLVNYAFTAGPHARASPSDGRRGGAGLRRPWFQLPKRQPSKQAPLPLVSPLAAQPLALAGRSLPNLPFPGPLVGKFPLPVPMFSWIRLLFHFENIFLSGKNILTCSV